ncbi:iron only hydrogenase large subunit, c-terminal domain-containing protein [Besnoitia besnoiti]|uniref:Iron only hydrogenase large subunit, c-terminal domain-containing protein n=1 Tax=Besnoitia besnoiti TaxID=94643 RepID=A0A2A9MLS7_BESBE|nr:iron only hydrogenase large subunit, c-terminal domain-containing protein [Besnoitia besnoiti]PFH36422.1 iron only hydrogenase large subunit, c-terminal domain-containing protein [Besnoitia besnoiti]
MHNCDNDKILAAAVRACDAVGIVPCIVDFTGHFFAPVVAALKLAELDDYLSPSQNCVVPLIVDSSNQRVPPGRPARVSGVKNDGSYRGGKRTATPSGGQNDAERVVLPLKSSQNANSYQRADLIRTERTGSAGTAGTATRNNVAGGLHARGGEGPSTGHVSHEQGNGGETNISGLSDSPKAIARVSLYDCLACSGCVTSAEAVLLDQHSVDQFLSSVRESTMKPVTVVSISFQSVTALAHEFRCAPNVMLRKLSTLFRLAGATYVLHTEVSDALAVLEAEREFVRRYREAQLQQAGSRTHECGSGDVSRRGHHGMVSSSLASGRLVDAASPASVSGGGFLPVLTSFCPGLMCYAEKSLDPSLLPYFSRVRSSQQLQGVLVKGLLRESHNMRLFFLSWRVSIPLSNWFLPLAVKQVLAQHCPFTAVANESEKRSPVDKIPTAEGDRPTATDASYCGNPEGFLPSVSATRQIWGEQASAEDIYHVSVMPCFDKKLEAARPEFRTSNTTGTSGVEMASEGRELPPSSLAQRSESPERDGSSHSGDTPDVDLVLATTEVLTLMERLGVTFDELGESPVDDFSSLLWQNNLFSWVPAVKSANGVGDSSLAETGASKDSPLHAGSDFTRSRTRALGDKQSRGCASVGSPPIEDDRGQLLRPSEYLSGSGGYTDRVFRRAAWELFGINVEGPLQFKEGRNEDYKEVALVVDGQEKLRFAIAYGFRNIQNVVQRLKREVREETSLHTTRDRLRSTARDPANRGESDPPHAEMQLDDSAEDVVPVSRGRGQRGQTPFPHFIELAACPGGCLNGAGQALAHEGIQRATCKTLSDGKSIVSTKKHRAATDGSAPLLNTGEPGVEHAANPRESGIREDNTRQQETRRDADTLSRKPAWERQEPLTGMADLLQSSFVFQDPLRWPEVELAYKFLQGRPSGPSKRSDREATRMQKVQARLSRQGRGRKVKEPAHDWWQEVMKEETAWEKLYTDFKSILPVLTRGSGTTRASLKW